MVVHFFVAILAVVVLGLGLTFAYALRADGLVLLEEKHLVEVCFGGSEGLLDDDAKVGVSPGYRINLEELNALLEFWIDGAPRDKVFSVDRTVDLNDGGVRRVVVPAVEAESANEVRLISQIGEVNGDDLGQTFGGHPDLLA